MKTIIKFVTAMLFAFFSLSAMAGEQNLYFADQAKCDVALSAGTAMFYTPTLNRPAPKNWKTDTLKASKCVQMETVQGMQFVALSVGSPMAQNPASKAWHHRLCTNWTNWLPGNNQSEPIASQLPGVIQAVGGGVVLKGMQCDAKCQQVKICGENGLTPLDKMNENGEWLCQAPDLKIVVIQNGSIRGEVHLEQKGWTVSGNSNLPAAPMDFNVTRPNASVSGTRCETQGCSYKPVAKFISEEKADFCGIHTSDGRVFKLGRHPTNGELVIADWTSGVQGKVMGLKQQATRDCDVDQKAAETIHWPAITHRFGLPNDCTITKRSKGKM